MGAEVAAKLGYQVGGDIVVAHGAGDVSFITHDSNPFRITGILARTGTPVDRTVFVNLSGIDAIHAGMNPADDHDHEHLSGGMQVTEFLLVPFLPQHPCQHALWDPNQVVYVNLLKPVTVDNPEEPVWVVGTITLDNIMTDDGPSAYRIVDAITTDYEY